MSNEAIIAAAFAACGSNNPDDPEVIKFARSIKAAAKGTTLSRALAEFDGVSMKGEPMDIKQFSGTILGIIKEEKTSRGVISIYTGTDHPKWGSLNKYGEHPITKIATPGVEHIRTDRTDAYGAMGVVATDTARMIQNELVGHRCFVTVKKEPSTGDSQAATHRIILAIADQGITNDAEAIKLLLAGHSREELEKKGLPVSKWSNGQ